MKTKRKNQEDEVFLLRAVKGTKKEKARIDNYFANHRELKKNHAYKTFILNGIDAAEREETGGAA